MSTAIKWIVVTLLVLHGLIDVTGFLKEWQLADTRALTNRTIVLFSETTLQKSPNVRFWRSRISGMPF